jgi:hypothetical protein
MAKLDALARSGEDHRVLAHHVAAAERREPDIALAPWADIAVTCVDSLFLKGDATRGGRGIAE